jgi:5'-methylthioadenosine phosphorylase
MHDAASEGRLAIVTGTNPPAAALLPRGEERVVEVDGVAVTAITDHELVVLDRHGLHDRVPAHRIDHVANMSALAALGCDRVLALSSTGSLRLDWPVGTLVAPHDLFAPWASPSMFDDLRGHSVPGFDAVWRDEVVSTWRAVGATPLVDGGVYAQMRGPRFETPAEIRFLASVADLVGMTVASECIVAREAGLAHAAVCVVDNLANGVGLAPLTMEEFAEGVQANQQRVVADLLPVVAALRGARR